jgi:hypothetical protein
VRARAGRIGERDVMAAVGDRAPRSRGARISSRNAVRPLLEDLHRA